MELGGQRSLPRFVRGPRHTRCSVGTDLAHTRCPVGTDLAHTRCSVETDLAHTRCPVETDLMGRYCCPAVVQSSIGVGNLFWVAVDNSWVAKGDWFARTGNSIGRMLVVVVGIVAEEGSNLMKMLMRQAYRSLASSLIGGYFVEGIQAAGRTFSGAPSEI